MSRDALGGIVATLGAVSTVIFVVVAFTEFNYQAAHPYDFGPALSIAWGGVAGALIGAAVCLLGIVLINSRNAGS